jgi:transcriptional regulator with XRE-family HTH domain
MRYQQLPNYLRMYRMRMGLSAKDVAFLLNIKSASNISRYEHFHRSPSLRNRLSLMAIFQCEMNELFPGEYQKAELKILRRAKFLHGRIARFQSISPRVSRKLASLRSLAEHNEDDRVARI